MGCEKIEKWLSDNVDGELSEKRKKILSAHLKRCISCRSYIRDLERIHKETKSFKMPEVSPAFWEEFNSRLKKNISSTLPKKEKSAPVLLRWKWAWVGAAFVFVIVVGLFLFIIQNKTTQEMFIFSFEDSLEKIYQEIDNDLELEDLFNSIILASIGETLEDFEGAIHPDFYEYPFLLESITEEEMKFLESELKKDTKL